MFWTWSSGYIFVKYEGKFALETGTQLLEPVSYHCGTDASYRTVTLELPEPLVVAAEETANLTLTLDAASTERPNFFRAQHAAHVLRRGAERVLRHGDAEVAGRGPRPVIVGRISLRPPGIGRKKSRPRSRVTFLRNIRGLKGGPLGYSVSRFVVRAYGRVATACCHEVARAFTTTRLPNINKAVKRRALRGLRTCCGWFELTQYSRGDFTRSPAH